MSVGTTLTVGFDGKAVQRGLANLSKSFGSLAMGGIGSIVKPFAQLSAMLAPTALIGGMVAFGKASSDAAANLENIKANFDIFTGSSTGTDKLISQLRKIAVESPLELTDIAEGARQLLLFGNSAEDTAKHIEQLSEISGGSEERFGRLAYAFGQVKNLGYILGTEVRQLNEAGFNPLTEIMKKTGETADQLQDRMADHKVVFSEVADAMKTATSEGGRFFGLNAKMSQTFSGRVSMMKDQWTQLTQSFGTGMNEGLKVAANAITENIPQFIEQFRAIGSYFGQAIAESVNGNHDKFVAIGKLIADLIVAGFEAASYTGLTKVWNGIGDLLAGMQVGITDKQRQSLSPKDRGATFEQQLEAALINRGIKEQAQNIMGTTPAPYKGSPQSPAFIEASLKAFGEKMDKIEANTRAAATKGSKM